MPVVRDPTPSSPPNAGPELEKRFANRAHAVDNQPGFLGFGCCASGQGRRPLLRGHAVSRKRHSGLGLRAAVEDPPKGNTPTVATGHRCWSSRLCWTLQGLAPTRSPSWKLHRVEPHGHRRDGCHAAIGCAQSAAPAAEVSYRATSTPPPPGLRAKQTMDMLNSVWPIRSDERARSRPRRRSTTSAPDEPSGTARSR